MELLIPASGLIYSVLGGDCIGAAFIFAGILSLKCAFKDRPWGCLTEPTASKFLSSLHIVSFVLAFDFFPRVSSADKAL